MAQTRNPLFRAVARWLFAATTLASVLSAGVVLAVPEAAFESAFRQFASASAGDGDAVDRAAEAFDTLLKTEPANPVLMAYAGASTSMRASTTILPWKKMGYAEDGLALIDKALALLTPAHDAPLQRGVPGVLEVKFVAASTFLAVPSFMQRSARGGKLLDQVLASPLLASAPLPFKGAVWMRAAEQAATEQRSADARRWLNEVIAQHAPQADKARARLKDLSA
jgi:hypothetical protein